MINIQKLTCRALAAALTITLLSACGDGTESEKKEEMKDTVMAPEPILTAKDSNITYTLPSTLQVASILKKSGLSYYTDLTNPTTNLNSYKTGTQYQEALILGVYSADLGYCILNKQTDESLKYFKACKEMGSELGVGKPFESVGKRMEKNLNTPDSMALILIAIQMETDNILASSNQEHVSVITFTGAWIETMYIAFQVHSKEGHKNMSEKLIEQMGIAENIIKALQANRSKDKHIDDLIAKMQSLNSIYNNFKSVKAIKATDPDVIDPAKLEVTLDELYAFGDRLKEIRAEITKG